MRILLHTNRRCSPDEVLIEFECYFSRNDRKFIRPGVRIEKRFWDEKANQVKHTHKNFIEYNAKIRLLDERLKSIIEKYLKRGIKLSGAILQSEIANFEGSITFNQYAKQQLENDKSFLKDSTYRQNLSVLNDLNKWKPEIYFWQIDNEFIRQYHNHLLGTMANNSTSKNHKKLGKWIRRAVQDKLMDVDPYKYFKIPSVNKRKIFLTEAEIDIIRTEQFDNDKLDHIRNRFLFLLNTGMEYADQEALKWDDIIEINSKMYIVKDREKYEEGIQAIPLFDEALEILNKYPGTGKIFPAISNQKYNLYLADIGIICKIKKPLTTIVARHTFATHMLTKGMPLETVSHILGHTNIKTTRDHYAKLVTTKVAEDLKRLNIKGI